MTNHDLHPKFQNSPSTLIISIVPTYPVPTALYFFGTQAIRNVHFPTSRLCSYHTLSSAMCAGFMIELSIRYECTIVSPSSAQVAVARMSAKAIKLDLADSLNCYTIPPTSLRSPNSNTFQSKQSQISCAFNLQSIKRQR